jgi:Domain of unknown function (DUF4375)
MNMPLSAVVAKDQAGGYSDAEFDDALWLALCERVRSIEELEGLPPVARTYYASRYVEWEVGNGGFAQAVLNVPEFLEPAAKAFEVLGKPEVSARIREAAAIYSKEVASLPEVRPGNEPALSDYFLDNAFTHLDEGLEELGFWSDKERIAFVRAHRHEFANAV